MSSTPPDDGAPRGGTPPPLTVAASVVAVQGLVLVMVAVLELASVSSSRLGLGVSTAGFFAAYGALLVAAGWGVWRRHGWARGPVLLTQLIVLGLAWTLRDEVAVAVGLALCAAIVLAGMLHPDTVAALDEGPDQASASSD